MQLLFRRVLTQCSSKALFSKRLLTLNQQISAWLVPGVRLSNLNCAAHISLWGQLVDSDVVHREHWILMDWFVILIWTEEVLRIPRLRRPYHRGNLVLTLCGANDQFPQSWDYFRIPSGEIRLCFVDRILSQDSWADNTLFSGLGSLLSRHGSWWGWVRMLPFRLASLLSFRSSDWLVGQLLFGGNKVAFLFCLLDVVKYKIFHVSSNPLYLSLRQESSFILDFELVVALHVGILHLGLFYSFLARVTAANDFSWTDRVESLHLVIAPTAVNAFVLFWDGAEYSLGMVALPISTQWRLQGLPITAIVLLIVFGLMGSQGRIINVPTLHIFGALVAVDSLLMLHLWSVIILAVGPRSSLTSCIHVGAVKIVCRVIQFVLWVRTTAVWDRFLHSTASIVSTLWNILVQLIAIESLSVGLLGLELIVLNLIPEVVALVLFRLESDLKVVIDIWGSTHLSLQVFC